MTTFESRTRLCVFARVPVLGGVKRRLAADIGEAAALAAHIQLTEDTLRRLAVIDGLETQLWLAGEPNGPVRRWLDSWPMPLYRQRGVDLGERMADALARCNTEGFRGLVVGCDCPPVDAAYVRQAAQMLDEADLVLGPALDGGYCLVGTRRPIPQIFLDIPWGTDLVLQTTLQRIGQAGVSFRLLEPVWDVDTASDWARYLQPG